MKVADIFHYKTIEKLAAFIQADTSPGDQSAVSKIAEMTDYALSPAQKRLWILAQLENGNTAFNMSSVYTFTGTLDEKAFEASFHTLVSRHDVLRTTFRENASGEIRQWVHPEEEFSFRVRQVDLRDKPDKEALLKKFITEAIATQFDMVNGPLLSVQLYRIAKDQWVFTYVIHHIICDGWSMNVIIKELLQLYAAYCNGEVNPLPPLTIQYKDYLAWRSERLINANKLHKAYWKQQLGGELPLLELPTDRTRPIIKSYAGSVVYRKWDRDLVSGVKELMKLENTTLYAGLLSIVYTLLYRYTGQNDIIVGSPFASRDSVELENQVGLYINTLPLRTIFNDHDDFTGVLGKVHQTLMGAYEHQEYNLDHILDELQLKRDVSRSSLFDVLVVLQNNENTSYSSGIQLNGVQIAGYPAINRVSSKFDLSFYFVEVDGEVHVSLEYSSDLFERETAERIASHLERLATVIVCNPALSLHQLDYLDKEEKDTLLYTFNNTDVVLPTDQTVVDLFEVQAEQHASSVAVVFDEEVLTYTELNALANQFAQYLISVHDVKPEELVTVAIGRNEWVVPVIMGISKQELLICQLIQITPQRESTI